MGCPHPLQPHQIQGGVGGSDFAAISNVINWLIKKYFQRKDEIEFLMRSLSLYNFSKNYNVPGEVNLLDKNVSKGLSKVTSSERSVRKFKGKILLEAAEDTRVRACLLEFGEKVTKLPSDYVAGATANESVSSSQSSATSSGMPVINLATLTSALSGLSKTDNHSELSAFEKQLSKVTKEAKREELLLNEKALKEVCHYYNNFSTSILLLCDFVDVILLLLLH